MPQPANSAVAGSDHPGLCPPPKRQEVGSPEAAAPQVTPQIRGTHVTGFVSCKRIFQIFSVVEAPGERREGMRYADT